MTDAICCCYAAVTRLLKEKGTMKSELRYDFASENIGKVKKNCVTF